MSAVDPRLVGALQEQLGRRDALLRGGARRVGWKLGVGRRERIGGHIAIGYLTTASLLGHAETVAIAALTGGDLHADAELCIELGTDLDHHADSDAVRAGIAHCWPALEIVDLAPRAGEPEAVVVENVFHVAVAIGGTSIPLMSKQEVMVYVNGELRDRAPWPTDVVDRVTAAAPIVGVTDDKLRAGDRIITGSVVQLPVTAGDQLHADFGYHGSIALNLLADA
jgi:2-keto-4-pentenoate hydratase